MLDVDVLTVTVLALLIAGATIDTDKPVAPKTWFGPVTVSFAVQFTGNPYDPDQNDLRVAFSDGKGHAFERLAYFDEGVWKATLVAPEPGTYTATLIRNGKTIVEISDPDKVVLDKPVGKGYVRCDSAYTNRFRWDNGDRWFPVGHNLGWPSGPLTFEDHLKKMKEIGADWARVWACAWSGFNPWWNGEPPAPLGQLWSPALTNWQNTIEQCEANNVKIQMVLFHHGLFSSSTNSNWSEHPWNDAKDGFLKNPEDFFTDAEAERRTKMWLRYAVARWAHSPSIMAWELFNEVEWTDGYKKNLPSVVAWHNKMAAYIRSIDPYGHLITTSSSLEHLELFASMDYYQPHTYPVDLTSTITTAKAPTAKPLFFGECGLVDNVERDEVHTLRDALYAGMLANQAATGMYWSWDRLERLKLFGEIKVAAEVVQVSRIADHPTAKPVQVAFTSAGQGVLTLSPGKGWATNEIYKMQLPLEGTPENLAKLSGFLQSLAGSHKDMFTNPLEFSFTNTENGEFGFHLAGMSKAGAHVRLWLDGLIVCDHQADAAEKDRQIDHWLRTRYKAGSHVVTIDNIGSDWAVFDKIELKPFGSQATARSLSESDWMLSRIAVSENAVLPLHVKVTKLILADGDYELNLWNLDTGEKKTETVKVKDFELVGGLALPCRDVVIVLQRKM